MIDNVKIIKKAYNYTLQRDYIKFN
jgi:hypothetical protein